MSVQYCECASLFEHPVVADSVSVQSWVCKCECARKKKQVQDQDSRFKIQFNIFQPGRPSFSGQVHFICFCLICLSICPLSVRPSFVCLSVRPSSLSFKFFLNISLKTCVQIFSTTCVQISWFKFLGSNFWVQISWYFLNNLYSNFLVFSQISKISYSQKICVFVQ